MHQAGNNNNGIATLLDTTSGMVDSKMLACYSCLNAGKLQWQRQIPGMNQLLMSHPPEMDHFSLEKPDSVLVVVY